MLSCANKMFMRRMATDYLYDKDKSINEECSAERYRYIRAELMRSIGQTEC